MLHNPRSLNNKIASFMDTLVDHSVDIAGVCETWFSGMNSPITSIIRSMGYSIIHNFRNDKKGGGTAIIYRSCYTLSVENFSHPFNTFELTAAVIKSASAKILLLVMYRTGPLSSYFNQELDILLSEISTKFDCFVISGDLNIHFDDCYKNKLIKQTLDTFQSFGLRKLVSEPTHVGGGSLDQIFVYSLNDNLVTTIAVDALNNIGSDHFPVYCDINLSPLTKYFKSIQYRKLKEINDDLLSDQLLTVVDRTLDLKGSFSDLMSYLSQSTTYLLDEHAPFLEKTISVVDKAPWFDKEYRELRKIRRKAERADRKEKNPQLKSDLKLVHKKSIKRSH